MRLVWPSLRSWRSCRVIVHDDGMMMGNECVTFLDLFFSSGLEGASGWSQWTFVDRFCASPLPRHFFTRVANLQIFQSFKLLVKECCSAGLISLA
jgi:hypothetical protein